MVLESRPEHGQDRDETPDPPNGRRCFFHREVWDDRHVQNMRLGRCRRRSSGLTMMNGYRLSGREQLWRLWGLALSLWTTAMHVLK